MAEALMHSVEIKSGADKIYEAITTSEGLASFWTPDSKAEPKVGSIARFGFGGPVLEYRVAELQPSKLVRWTTSAGFPGWEGTEVTWEIVPTKDGAHEVLFSHHGWSKDMPQSELASVNYTWGGVVQRLKQYAETGKREPFLGAG